VAKAKATHKPKLDIVVDPKREKGLTEKQEKFARIYATEDVTRTEAARLAGYSESAVHTVGSRFLNGKDFPQIVARVAELKEELSKKYEVTFDGHIRQLARIRDMALDKGNYTAAVAAEKSRGQAAGIYISRHEVMVGKIDQMSREEVLAEIHKLQAQFPLLAADTAPTIDMVRSLRSADEIPDFVPETEREEILRALEE
jgi:phage terminase small subunit